MSRPIDIPFSRPSGHRLEVDLFPAEDGPYFGYIEVLEHGSVFWAVSSGSGSFVEIGLRRDLPSLAFIVEKDRITRKITLEIASPSLKQTIHRAILNRPGSHDSSALDFEALLKNYDALKSHLARAEARQPHAGLTAELRLLVCDLLLERSLYDGIGMEGFRQREVLCSSHLQDIHQRNIDLGLDEIQDCFALGLIPDDINQEYMDALNMRYDDLARAGDLHGLQNLCEPIVRSGEIELQYNPSLLLEVLDNGNLDMYQYMLALVDRTREDLAGLSEEDGLDITYNPFHVAIRLGRTDLVQYFVQNNAYFEGWASDCSSIGIGQLLNPLKSAVCWRQPDVVRLLLRSGPLYSSSGPLAVAMALNNDLQDILEVLFEFGLQSTATIGASSTSRFHVVDAGLPKSCNITSPLWPPVDLQECGVQEPAGLSESFVQGPASPNGTFNIHETGSSWPSCVASQAFTSSELPQLLDMPTSTNTHGSPFPNVHSHKPGTEGTSTPRPSARQRPSYQARRKYGRNFILQLESQYKKLQRLCQDHKMVEEYDRLLRRFNGLEDIWETGIRAFQSICQNRAPEDLTEVLCCLLVADAISSQVPNDADIHAHDLGRWRTAVSNDEKPLFDSVTKALWDFSETQSNFGASGERCELDSIQHLLQELVSVENLEERSRLKVRRNYRGSRLKTIYDRKGKSKASHLPLPTFDAMWDSYDMSCPSSMAGLSADTPSPSENDSINLGDFIYLDPLDDCADETTQPPATAWQDAWGKVKPTITLLLASVAFAMVISLLSGGNGLSTAIGQLFTQADPGPSRHCMLLGEFLKFEEPDAPMVPNACLLQPQQSSQISRMLKATSRPRSALHVLPAHSRLQPSFIGSTSGSPGSSIMSTDPSSPETARSPERLRCLSPRCTKSFSSVSNRNKHMREGCALREKRGYPCRNANCSKVLTTKWYRNTHEQTRCRFK
ncbi:hypothetical protein HJFPF1_07788 [Paramyrothecium foliicola]|nr:hypothetical protein HJFPF1_07788 [Paramyrothecium foliicola]